MSVNYNPSVKYLPKGDFLLGNRILILGRVVDSRVASNVVFRGCFCGGATKTPPKSGVVWGAKRPIRPH